MEPQPISNGLPNELEQQLMSNEKVYYFSFITSTGGCSSSQPRQNYWLALTDKRVLYKTKVTELRGNTSHLVEKDGILPFDKVSFIEVSEGKTASGCSNQQKIFQLRISTSGGTVTIPIPTKEKGYEIRQVFSELNQSK